MSTSGIFVYTILSTTTAGLGIGDDGVDGNGFVEKTKVSGVIKVPSFIGQYRIVSLLTRATRMCNLITKLILPDTLETIEFASLTEMSGIKEVRIPASVVTIKSNNDCYRNAKRIIFEKGSRLTSIGSYFMRYSPYIEEVVFPSSVKEIGSYFAQECTGLKRVYHCGNDVDFSSISNAFDNCPNKGSIKIYVSYNYNGTSFGGNSLIIKSEQCFAAHKCPIHSMMRCTRDMKALINIMLVIAHS